MEAAADIARELGLTAKRRQGDFTSVDLAHAIEDGLPVAALEKVTERIAPTDRSLKYQLVPKATLERRRRSPSRRLSETESERVARLAEVWRQAVAVFGAEDKARHFLLTPHPLLKDARPLELAWRTGVGARAVADLLGGLQYGTAV